MEQQKHLTKDAAADLAALLHRLRPEWHTTAIVNALHQAVVQRRGNAPTIAIAALRAAANPDCRTPAGILHEGAHWMNALPASRPTRVDRASLCSVCSLHEDRCRELWADDHEFLSVVQARRAAQKPPQQPPTPPSWLPDARPRTTAEIVEQADRRRPLGALPSHSSSGRHIEDVNLP